MPFIKLLLVYFYHHYGAYIRHIYKSIWLFFSYRIQLGVTQRVIYRVTVINQVHCPKIIQQIAVTREDKVLSLLFNKFIFYFYSPCAFPELCFWNQENDMNNTCGSTALCHFVKERRHSKHLSLPFLLPC